MRLPSLLFMLMLVTGSAQAREVTHELGTTNVPDAPQRIVLLEFSFIDALAALDLEPVGIADDDQRDRIQPVWSAHIGDDWVSVGSRKTPNLEVIASLQPDLIIADKSRHEAVYETLGQIAPTIVFDSLTGDYDDMLAVASRIGDAVGRSDDMRAFQTGHIERMDALRSEVSAKIKGQEAQFGVANTNGLWLHSPQSYVGSLLTSFGFANAIEPGAGDSYGELYQKVTLEQVSQLDPGLLILGKEDDEGESVDQIWNAEALWREIAAVKSERVFNVSSDLWSRARGMLTAEEIAADLRKIVAGLN